MSKPELSIALCTFNGARFLPYQLSSFNLQTRMPDELVICDDRSEDTTVKILEDFAKTAPFKVRLFVNATRLGPAQNFSKAIELCGGEIIALSDQDDVWKPHKIARILEAFHEHPHAGFVFSDAEMVDEFGTPLDETFWEAVELRRQLPKFTGAGQLALLLKHNIIPGASIAFRASLKSVLLPLPPGWMHDYWIALLGCTLLHAVPIDESLLLYRRHSEQVCGWRKLTFMQVLKTSLHTGPDDCRAKLCHFQQVLARISSRPEAIECAQDRVSLLKEKEGHLSTRMKIRASRGLRRIAMLLAEARSGRYARFSHSWRSIVRDLR